MQFPLQPFPSVCEHLAWYDDPQACLMLMYSTTPKPTTYPVCIVVYLNSMMRYGGRMNAQLVPVPMLPQPARLTPVRFQNAKNLSLSLENVVPAALLVSSVFQQDGPLHLFILLVLLNPSSLPPSPENLLCFVSTHGSTTLPVVLHHLVITISQVQPGSLRTCPFAACALYFHSMETCTRLLVSSL